jgi:hypothetical protein
MIELMIAAVGIGGIAVLAMKAGFSGSGWAAITLGAVIASLALPFPIFRVFLAVVGVLIVLTIRRIKHGLG